MFSLQDITSQILHEIVRLYLFTLSICQEQPGTGLTIMNECQNNFGTATAATTIQQQEKAMRKHRQASKPDDGPGCSLQAHSPVETFRLYSSGMFAAGVVAVHGGRKLRSRRMEPLMPQGLGSVLPIGLLTRQHLDWGNRQMRLR